MAKTIPAEASALRAFAIDGRVAPETMVYDHAAKNWVRADSIPGLCLLVFLFLTLNNGSSMLMLLSFCFALAFGIIGIVQLARK